MLQLFFCVVAFPFVVKWGKVRIVLDGLRGEDSIAEFCRREGIS